MTGRHFLVFKLPLLGFSASVIDLFDTNRKKSDQV